MKNTNTTEGWMVLDVREGKPTLYMFAYYTLSRSARAIQSANDIQEQGLTITETNADSSRT